MAAAVVLGMNVSFLIYFATLYFPPFNTYVPYTSDTATTTDYSLKRSEPVRLLIPKLSIDALFEEPLGLHPDRTIEVPKEYHTVGWYKNGASPGEIGPTAILGHVDSVDGAGVFYHLGQLVPGDRFTVERADGTKPEFEVVALERYSQDEFPTDLVYGPIGYAGIRLITCSGTYNKTTQRYDRNLVVYAKLVEPTKN